MSTLTIRVPLCMADAANAESEIQKQVDAGRDLLVVVIPGNLPVETVEAIQQGISGIVGEYT